MSEDIGLFEAMYTQRALRYLKTDPVPDDLVQKVIEAGIRAPNGGNSQQWGFVVIKDEATKRIIAEHYPAVGRPNHGEAATASERRAAESADYLGEHVMDVPVWILAVTRHPGTDIHNGASIYPAVQNMLLARAGLRARQRPHDPRPARASNRRYARRSASRTTS